MIEIKAKKKYGDRIVLDDSFTFLEGKIYAVIGTNGSGKSTLLSILSKQLKNDTETFVYYGEIGYMPQSSYAFNLSVKNSIKIAIPDLEKSKTIKQDYYKFRINRYLRELDLEKISRKKASKLSGGETQKVALARTLLCRHDLLLLDEPTSAMDIQATATAEKVLNDYISEFNPTLIFSTHSVKQAERIADYVIFLKDGKIIETATAKEFLENPQTEELKQFLQEK